MSEQAIKYFRDNKDTYPAAVLEKTLLDAGYVPSNVAESKVAVFGGVSPVPAVKTSFWDFHGRKMYSTSGEKWGDFFFGGFVPTLWLYPAVLTRHYGGSAYSTLDSIALFGSLLGFFAFFYLWNRRRLISVGLLCSFFLSSFLMGMVETIIFYF